MSDIKIYRGIEWEYLIDITQQLNREPCSIYTWLTKNPDKNERDYIDMELGELTYEEYVENNYKGGYIYEGFIWKYKNDVAREFGVTRGAISYWLKKHPGKTIKDYVKYYFELMKE